LAFLTVGLKTS